MRYCAFVLIAATTLAACSPDTAPKIAEPQRQALDKAKAASDQLNQQAIEQQQQIDQASK